MALIKKIDFDSVEKILKDIVEVSSKVRLMQEQLEAMLCHITNNEGYFKTFATSEGAFEENRNYFEKEKRRFSSEIAKSIKILLKSIDTLEQKIESTKI